MVQLLADHWIAPQSKVISWSQTCHGKASIVDPLSRKERFCWQLAVIISCSFLLKSLLAQQQSEGCERRLWAKAVNEGCEQNHNYLGWGSFTRRCLSQILLSARNHWSNMRTVANFLATFCLVWYGCAPNSQIMQKTGQYRSQLMIDISNNVKAGKQYFTDPKLGHWAECWDNSCPKSISDS